MPETIDLQFVPKGCKACSFRGKLRTHSSKKLHVHSYCEILLIKNGVSILVDENLRQPLFGRSLALIPSRTPHRSLVVGQSLEYLVLFVHEKLFPMNHPNIRIFNLSDLGLALFHRLCSVNGVEIAKGFMGECLKLFLLVIDEDIKNEAKIVRLPEAKSVNSLRIVKHIQSSFGRKLSISDFKKAVPYSARHISRLFSNEMGIGIFEYLRLYRILMASILISNSDKKVADIALDCGYESLSSFYRDFSTYYGIPPKILRKNLATEPP